MRVSQSSVNILQCFNHCCRPGSSRIRSFQVAWIKSLENKIGIIKKDPHPFPNFYQICGCGIRIRIGKNWTGSVTNSLFSKNNLILTEILFPLFCTLISRPVIFHFKFTKKNLGGVVIFYFFTFEKNQFFFATQ